MQEALLLADAVVVLERQDMEATELAVLGISPGAVQVRALDWQDDEGLDEILASLRCEQVLVLGAGETLDLTSYEEARVEIESLPDGPTQVRVGPDASPEVRLHPPTLEALAHIGSQDGPVAQTFAILPV